MRLFLWVVRGAVFLFLFAFAIRNTDPVGVHLFFDNVWHAPLVIVLLACFAGGALLALLSLLGTLFGQRREVARLKRALKEAQARILRNREHPV
ncbi:LapA family protein [Accumulibacter sp.]|uniref:LapA family protein n=1 Tax=Accumulibacter sp. TaxID=2053492 RepID=UPI0028C4D912|nr:LapA family protein [Accumulibacter sp.]